MKRKFASSVTDETKRTRMEGEFSVLAKRKHNFEDRHAKRFHQYSVVEEQTRKIQQLEKTVYGMLSYIKELEYQLQTERTRSHYNDYNRQIESY